MLLSKEGDIEMHELRDTQKHSIWSSRGDVALGAGTQYRVFSSCRVSEPIPEPWDLEARVEASQEAQHESTRKGPLQPARGQHKDLLGGVRDSSLSAMRLNQPRASSAAAAIRQFPLGSSGLRERASSFSPGGFGPEQSDATAQGSEKRLSHTDSDKQEHKDLSHSVVQRRDRVLENATFMMIKTDISMTIRLRVLEGYGLFNVRMLF